MRIQDVRFDSTSEIALWYRNQGEIKYQEDKLILGEKAKVFTNTYYNSFSLEKWNHYCDFKEISLKLTYKGSLGIKIYQSNICEEELNEKEIYAKSLHSEEEQEFCYVLPQEGKGVIYFVLETESEDAYIKDAYYAGECTKENEVVLALNICTFRREKELLRNVELLKKTFLQNNNETLNGHLKIFITDNGQTLDKAAIEEEHIYVTYNENIGGTGGFTRGLVEINKRKEQEKISHSIFMDDDIEIEPEALRRTYALLVALRETYKNAFIAGAMLRMDDRYIQYENGAWWRCGKVSGRHRGADLSDFYHVVKNEQLEDVEYASWWYCCVPMHIANNENLPVPFFLHGDDIEYSLRNASDIITLNGIVIRHPVINHKCTSANVYYDVRNTLIANTCCYRDEYKIFPAKKMAIQAMTTALLKYRYKDMHLIYQAVEDFCKGADWLLHLNAVSHNQNIQKMGYEFIDITKEVSGRADEAEEFDKGKLPGPLTLLRQSGNLKKKAHMLLQILTLNGWLLPAKRETGIFYMNVHPLYLYRKKKLVLFNEESMQGIVVQKSFGQLFVYLKLALKVNSLMNKHFEKSKESYYNSFAELTSVEYWRENYHY